MSPKYFGKLREIPVGSVQAGGWLGAYMGHMASGVAGRLDECGYPFETKGFACEKVDTGGRHGAEWWPLSRSGTGSTGSPDVPPAAAMPS
jgi:hypothetical protein